MTQIAQITSGVFKSGEVSYEFAHASVRKSNASKNDDTVVVLPKADELAVLVADGATGFGMGNVASGALGKYFASNFETPNTARKSKRFLIDADNAVRLACVDGAEESDTTGIVLSVSSSGIEGASAGDSQAIIFGVTTCELTAKQRRRPRIGNGAYPEEFTARLAPGDVLVLATDGLWNMVKQESVGKTALSAEGVDQAVAKLIASARNSAGNYSDDVSVVCVKIA
jgi:serine/threonine protein phosphatase PrpC|nr:SpoIIE family protein phosphatase [Neorhizobium tomejilense]